MALQTTAMHSFQQSDLVVRLISVSGIFKQLMAANLILSGHIFRQGLILLEWMYECIK